MKKKRMPVVVSLDIKKAFDTVWINALIYKMIQLSFSRPLIMFISSYLTRRRFKVSANDSDSGTYEVAAESRKVKF